MANPSIPTVNSPAPKVLDQEFLDLRARLLQIAAQLDRLDRAAGKATDDVRLRGVHKALAVLAAPGPNRAEQVQMIFSRPYDPSWKSKMELASGQARP
jgi:hypothetical protein